MIQSRSPSSSLLLKWGTVICVFVLVASRSGVTAADDKNITRLLNNQAIVSKQIMCVLEKSPCDQLGRQLKGNVVHNGVNAK